MLEEMLRSSRITALQCRHDLPVEFSNRYLLATSLRTRLTICLELLSHYGSLHESLFYRHLRRSPYSSQLGYSDTQTRKQSMQGSYLNELR